jgi:hypothetical protein
MTFNEALKVLKNATVVEGLHNSENGYMACFNLLLNHPNSKAFFEELICTSKTPEGVLYGLLGMYIVNKNIYYEMIKKTDVNKMVTVIIGDVIGRGVSISYYLPQIEDLSLLRNLQWE